MSTPRKTLVFGPAYVDRVVRVDRPLIDPATGGVIDQSVLGYWELMEESRRIEIRGLPSSDLTIDLPSDWPGPSGRIGVESQESNTHRNRTVECVAWHDDLGGMGAGYAKALGGRLHLIVGDTADPIHGRVIAMVNEAGIDHQLIRVPDRMGEWTLLLTSGEYGDKLPIGFRDPNLSEFSFSPYCDEACDLLVAASMTNAWAAAALKGRNATVRMFAPAMRNMMDTKLKISQFAKYIDILCCNSAEWEVLDDREEVAWRISILVITDGPRGAEIRYTTLNGDAGRLEIPSFPRRNPPRDTNRAGEAFASTFVSTLLYFGWVPGTTTDDLIERAAMRASASAALVLDRTDFGFASDSEIDRSIRDGIV